MTTTQPTPDRMTATELREAFDAQRTLIHQMREAFDAQRDLLYQVTDHVDQLAGQLDTVTETLNNLLEKLANLPRQVAAPAAAPSPEGLERITVHTVTLTYDKTGQPIYQALGGKYSRFGARIWPEVLPALAIDPATLKPGPNPWAATVLIQPAPGERAPKVINLA